MKNKDTKNKEILDKMIAEANALHKTRENMQLKLWEAMLEQFPECSDAWWEIYKIVSTAKFMRDHSKYIELGSCDLLDAPLVVQMLRNMCWDYNHSKSKSGWMLDTVLGMEEYGISKFQAIGILRCVLQVGVLREWFWVDDINAPSVPSMLDTSITEDVAHELANEYKNTLLECIGPDYDIGQVMKFGDFLKKYLKTETNGVPRCEIDDNIFDGDLGLP